MCNKLGSKTRSNRTGITGSILGVQVCNLHVPRQSWVERLDITPIFVVCQRNLHYVQLWCQRHICRCQVLAINVWALEELLGRIKMMWRTLFSIMTKNLTTTILPSILAVHWEIKQGGKEGVINYTSFLRCSLMLSNSHTRTFSVPSDGFLLLKNAIAAGKMPWPLWRQSSLDNDSGQVQKGKGDNIGFSRRW